MKSPLSCMILGLAVLLAGCASNSARVDEPSLNSTKKLNLMIMVGDSDVDSIPADSRALRRALATISEPLIDAGFSVYDEDALLSDDLSSDRTRRTDAELIDSARSVPGRRIDVVVAVTLYANARDKGYGTEIAARMEGRLLNVRSSKSLGNAEVKAPDGLKAPANCARECIMEIVGQQSSMMGADLGTMLSNRLEEMDGSDSATD